MTRSAPASNTPTRLAWLRPERVFLAVGLVFGLMNLFLNPPFQAPDEPDHFFRAFQLSEGKLVGVRRGQQSGGDLPLPIMAVADTEGIAFHPEKKMSVAIIQKKLAPAEVDWTHAPRGYAHFPHTVVYSPVTYAPQIVALGLGKVVSAGPLLLLYLCRLAVLGAYLLVGWLALRRLPVRTWSCLLLLMVPMSLYLGSATAAPDSLLNCLAFLLVALAVAALARPAEAPERMGELVGFGLAVALVAILKNVYLPLGLAALLLRLTRISTPRRRVIFGITTLLVAVLPVLVWSQFVSAAWVVGRSDIPIDPVAQARHVVGDPLGFLALVGHTLHVEGVPLYRSFVGLLGWGDTDMPEWFYRAFGIGFVLCLLAESSRDDHVSWSHRGLFAVAVVGSLLLVFLAQYSLWNAPGSTGPIEGVGGRYFLPMAPFLVFCAPPIRWVGVPSGVIAAGAAILTVLCGAVTVYAVVARYYVS
ncbi:DUF2142 domain-containing protein [Opitutus sp. ER46]|uniref:DUF2142 domain-containing protein n=1 Tax=Opitutus sp. ER46 TaxID=2161864 RepID=UPI000D321A00|nr:DUF2142 domain-containing protein [Opitutus sp. ER46]PTX92579.1 hypothetical protein DB354_14720 [Opitutus sp. ER46]